MDPNKPIKSSPDALVFHKAEGYLKLLEANPPLKKFTENIINNTFFAYVTVPVQSLAVDRVLFKLDNPSKKSSSYLKRIKTLGLRALFAGKNARATYCLVGNLATLEGNYFYGDDLWGIFYTAATKNLIYPLSLISDARQKRFTWEKTARFVCRGFFLDPIGHAGFFARNWLANMCVIPGIITVDWVYRLIGEENTIIPKLCGISVATFFSTFINTLIKPTYTGKFPLKSRIIVAFSMTGLIPTTIREIASLSVFFSGKTPQKKGGN